jgi:hypothetical protein
MFGGIEPITWWNSVGEPWTGRNESSLANIVSIEGTHDDAVTYRIGHAAIHTEGPIITIV